MNILRIASEIVALNTQSPATLVGPFVQSDEAEMTFEEVTIPAISGKLVGLLAAGSGEDETETMESFMDGSGTTSIGVTIIEKNVTRGIPSLDRLSPDDPDEMDFDWEVSHVGGFKLSPSDSKLFNEAFSKTPEAGSIHEQIESKLWDMVDFGGADDFDGLDDIYLDRLVDSERAPP